MAVLGLRDAAAAVAVTRQTIYRYTKSGKLSTVTRDDGTQGVDTSELLRVFGSLRDPATVAPGGNRAGSDRNSDTLLHGELEALKRALAVAESALAQAAERERSMLDERAKMLDMLDRQTRLLGHQADHPAPLPTIDPEAIEGASKKKLRKLLKRLLGAGVILLLAQLPGQAWAFKTLGVPSCGAWVEGRQNHGQLKEVAVRIWLAGYLTGVADSREVDILRDTDSDSIAAWMDNYCRASPLDDLIDGGRELREELIQRQQNP
jgi:hypothetical protein